MTDSKPASWMTLEEGTTVVSSDGTEVGKVTAVVADEQKDIFSGVEFRSGLLGAVAFAPAAIVSEITSDRVTLSASAEEAEKLAPRES